jgi:hypothetical protein
MIRTSTLFHLDNTSNDDKYAYNWPSIYPATKNQSPKLYTLVNNLRRAQLQKQQAIRQQSSNDDENEVDADVFPQVMIFDLFSNIFIFLLRYQYLDHLMPFEILK